MCFDTDDIRIGLVRGTLRKRVWINIGDIILVSLRQFDKNKCDIIHHAMEHVKIYHEHQEEILYIDFHSY